MAAPGYKQICYICKDEVTEAQYRRELTCSYTACPGMDHGCHEECITEYLRKLKLPVDRLIGYPCPVVLDNGRPCTGCITRTHHRQPLNQKKKQKRVEAAAAAAAAPKPKPLPPKSKEAKQSVAAATAAMRPAGEAALRQAGVSINAVKYGIPVVKGSVQPQSIGKGPAANLTGTAQAVQNNTAMAPDRVVRQRIIPGWIDPKEQAKEQAKAALAQQRAKAAALQAEARSAVGRSVKAAAAGGAASTSGFAPAPSGPAAAGRQAQGERARPQPLQLQRDDSEDAGYESEVSDTDPFSRWLRSTDGFRASTEQDFNLAQEDFPAIPAGASGSFASTPVKGAASASANALPELDLQSDSNLSSPDAISPMFVSAPPSSYGPDSSTQPDAAAPASPALGLEYEDPMATEDPVLGHDELFWDTDGVMVIMDAYGNFKPMQEVYGEAPEMIGFQEESGNIRYYVVIRESLYRAQMALQESALPATANSSNDVSGGGSSISGDSAPAMSVAMPPGGAMYDEVSAGLVGAAGMGVSAATMPTGLVADPLSTASSVQPPAVPAFLPVPVPAVVAEHDGGGDDGGDLNDILALCMGGAPATDAALVPDPPSLPDPEQPFAFAPAGYAQVAPVPQPVYGDYYADAGAGFIVAPGAGCADAEQNDADDVNSLMQLLCF